MAEKELPLTLTSRKTFQLLAEKRLREAIFLEKNKEYSGAYYLSGYAIECALKAVIARKFKANAIPDHGYVQGLFSHNLSKLMNRTALTVPKELEAKWGIVSKWTEQSRYDLSKSKEETRGLLNAIDGKDGLLAWLKKYW